MKKTIFDFVKYHMNLVLKRFFAKEPLSIGNSKRSLDRQTVIDILYDARFSAELYAFYGIRERLTDEVNNFIKCVEPYFNLPYDEGMKRIHPLKEAFLNQWLTDCINRSFEDKSAKGNYEEKGNNHYPGGENASADFFRLLKKNSDKTGAQLVDNMQELLECKACGRNSPFYHKASARFLKNTPRGILKLAKLLGRDNSTTENADPRTDKFQTAAKTDINGITMGRDLACVVPAEIALLSSPSLENLFFKKVQNNSLQLFQSKSEQKVKASGEGPIMIAVDTSGSMWGKREIVAKTLALATILVAQKKKRPVELYKFSIQAEKIVITDFIKQRKEITDFISNSQGGGTDVYDALRQMTSNYSNDESVFKNADILLVSDFEIPTIPDNMVTICKEAIGMGARFYALNVGRENENNFFNLCHKRYTNSGNDVIEVHSKQTR